MNLYILGTEIARLVDRERFEAGSRSITFDARRISSGVYFYRLETEQIVRV